MKRWLRWRSGTWVHRVETLSALGNAALPSDQLSRWIPQPSLYKRVSGHQLFISYSGTRPTENISIKLPARGQMSKIHIHDHWVETESWHPTITTTTSLQIIWRLRCLPTKSHTNTFLWNRRLDLMPCRRKFSSAGTKPPSPHSNTVTFPLWGNTVSTGTVSKTPIFQL